MMDVHVLLEIGGVYGDQVLDAWYENKGLLIQDLVAIQFIDLSILQCRLCILPGYPLVLNAPFLLLLLQRYHSCLLLCLLRHNFIFFFL